MTVSRLSLVTAPTVLPLHLNELKAHLRVEDTDNNEDALIMAYLRAAIDTIDGRDGWLGRALTTQTWDYLADHFPSRGRFNQFGAIEVPLPPLQSVTSVKYTDGDGTQQTWATSKYTVSGVNSWGKARIMPAYGEVWPTTRSVPDAVEIRFVAGYTDTASNTQNAVPVPIRQALLLMAAHRYEQRQEIVVGTIVARIPNGADALLAPYRVHSVA